MKCFLVLVSIILFLSNLGHTNELSLEEGFQNPPHSVRPQVWWWFSTYKAASKDAITRDLEGLAAVGISGFHIYGGSENVNDHWREKVRWALHEASRLNLEGIICIGNAGCGSHKTPPALAQKELVFTRVKTDGGTRIEISVPKKGAAHTPKTKEGVPKWYWDVAIFAVPIQKSPVSLSQIIDLSPYFDKNSGRLGWDAPTGKWEIIRIGYAPNVFGWSGCYIDHMSRKAFDFHWNLIMTPLLAELTPQERSALGGVMCDSWECGKVSWTEGFAETFQKARGYNIHPWLPTLAGFCIESPGKTARFHRDFAETISELIAENHYAYQKEVANRHGLRSIAEAAGPHQHQADVWRLSGRCDVSMGEFWMPSNHRPTPPQRFMVRDAANAAHVYGIKEVLAEAFTTINTYWIESPRTMKPCADRAFCDGLNRVCYHGMMLSPSLTQKPGHIRNVGTHYNPQTTWFADSGAWNLYLSRCSWMLQQGKPVADILLYAGDSIDLFAGLKTPEDGLGNGFDYDFCPTELLLQAKVENGWIVLPSGVRYRALMLADKNKKSNRMNPGKLPPPPKYTPVRYPISEAAVRQLHKLVQNGATLVGTRPDGPTSMKDSSETYHQIADQLWGMRNHTQAASRNVGKGRVFRDRAALRNGWEQENIPQDFSAQGADIDWIHRNKDNTEIYFLSNQKPEAVSFTAHFRQTNGKVSIWNPVTGTRSGITHQRGKNAISTLLSLPAYGSCFVVIQPEELPVAHRQEKQNLLLSGSWKVTFDPKWGGPGESTFAALTDWTAHTNAGIRGFSGSAVYEKTFNAPPDWKPGHPVRLSLGTVREIAVVKLNGRTLGTCWTEPYEIILTHGIKAKENRLQIRVTNLWPNRLIADAALPPEKRVTKTNISHYKPSDNPLPSGLLGPVILHW